jgi:hypothetical protein
MRNLFGILFFTTLFCVGAAQLLEWIGVKNMTLNIIIWIALLPLMVKYSNDLDSKSNQ